MEDQSQLDLPIYGPIPGVGFVPWATYQAYAQNIVAQDQKEALATLQQDEKSAGLQLTNPFAGLPSSSPPATTTTTSSSSSSGKSHVLAGGGGLSDYCFWYPDDPLCEFYAGGGGGGGGGGGTTVNETIVIEGLQATDVNEAIDNGLSAVWSSVVGAVDSVLALAIGSIQSALTAIGNGVKAVFGTLARLAGFILGFLDTLLRKIVSGILQVLKDIRDLVKHLVDDVLKPLAAALQKIRDKLIDLYQRFVRPVIAALQYFRQLLSVLALFHVPFAKKLDAKLADLERRITQPLFTLLAFTNGIANYINLILTANYLLQKPVWLWSLNAYMGSTINAQINAINPPPNAAAAAALRAKYVSQPAAKSSTDFNQWAATGTGDAAGTIADYGNQFDQLVNQGF